MSLMPDYTFEDCMEILKDINYANPQYMVMLNCFRHVSNIHYDRHTLPLESIWPYKNLLKYYSPNEIKSMLYEE